MSKTKRNNDRRRQVGCGRNRKTKMKRGGCITCAKFKPGGTQTGGNFVGIGANLTSWVPYFFTTTLPNALMTIPSQAPFW